MKCANCPLFSWWNNESDKGESCGLFGDSWDSAFQYEDKDGNIVGCYIDRHYIEQTDERYCEHLEEVADSFFADEKSCNNCIYSMQNCNDKSICCEMEDGLCDEYEKEKKHELGMDTHILCE